MKQFLTLLSIFLVGSLMVVTDADARRLGGGRSFGMQRNISPTPKTPTQAAPAAPSSTAAAQPGRSRWLGPIAGLAAGLGLAALFSHLGLGEEFGTLVMVMLLVAGALFLFRMLRRSSQPNSPLQYAGSPRGLDAEQPAVRAIPTATGESGSLGAGSVPADFDVDGFLRQAKVNFVRLQTAHDAGNLEDIRDFTSPEVFAEIRLDLQDRGTAAQKTDVVVLNADLLDVSEEARQYVASIRFYGTIREQEGAAPAPFAEIWHLTKPVDSSRGWQVAGIQQGA